MMPNKLRTIEPVDFSSLTTSTNKVSAEKKNWNTEGDDGVNEINGSWLRKGVGGERGNDWQERRTGEKNSVTLNQIKTQEIEVVMMGENGVG